MGFTLYVCVYEYNMYIVYVYETKKMVALSHLGFYGVRALVRGLRYTVYEFDTLANLMKTRCTLINLTPNDALLFYEQSSCAEY